MNHMTPITPKTKFLIKAKVACLNPNPLIPDTEDSGSIGRASDLRSKVS